MIMVYAKIKGTKHFLGEFDDLETLKADVYSELSSHGKTEWIHSVFFLLNGEEYKLFTGDEE